jgi:tRNA(fMet)-specific endonuclease VapC
VITHLLDTDWFVDYINGRRASFAAVDSHLESASLATSVIVLAEVQEGILSPRTPIAVIESYENLAGGLEVIPIEAEMAPTFASLRGSLRARGQMIGDHDIWIAATALEYGLTILSRNKHFDRIPGLRLQR